MPIKDSLQSQNQKNNKNVRQKKGKEKYLRERYFSKTKYLLFCFVFNSEARIRLHLKAPRSREVTP